MTQALVYVGVSNFKVQFRNVEMGDSRNQIIALESIGPEMIAM